MTPVIIVVGAKEESAWVRRYDRRNFADVDATIAATHMMLAVEELGLGTVWVGHFDVDSLKAAYPDMKDYDLIALFPIGYPADDVVPSSWHDIRKPDEELFEILS